METALLKMGYRKMDVSVWGKPNGYQLWVVVLRKNKYIFENRFKGVNGKYLVWDRTEVSDLDSLKEAEHTLGKSIGAGNTSFDFLLPSEIL